MHNNVLALVTLYFLTETSCLSDMSQISCQSLSMYERKWWQLLTVCLFFSSLKIGRGLAKTLNNWSDCFFVEQGVVCMLCRRSWKLFQGEDWSWQWSYARLSTGWHANYGYVAFLLHFTVARTISLSSVFFAVIMITHGLLNWWYFAWTYNLTNY